MLYKDDNSLDKLPTGKIAIGGGHNLNNPTPKQIQDYNIKHPGKERVQVEESRERVRIADVISEERLRELYVDRNMTAQRIADDLGVEYSRLREFIKTHGIRKKSYKKDLSPVTDVSQVTAALTINKQPIELLSLSNIDNAIMQLEQDLSVLRKARDIVMRLMKGAE